MGKNAMFSLEWTVKTLDADKLLRKFLLEQKISKASLKTIKFDGGTILVNNFVVNVRYRLQAGDVVKIIFPEEKISQSLLPKMLPLNIVYEDSCLLVVNKPAGLNTIPSRRNPFGSLANAVAYYYQKINLSATIHIVTRLDKNTSGLVLIAKNRYFHNLFSQKLLTIERTYEAFVAGTPPKCGEINAPIARKNDSIILRTVSIAGKPAQTNFQTLANFKNFTHLKLKLKTGRTHQIRVHLSSIGHPLLGDDLYGGNLEQISRQALHCTTLKFTHPVYKNMLQFESELPNDMKEVLTVAIHKQSKHN